MPDDQILHEILSRAMSTRRKKSKLVPTKKVLIKDFLKSNKKKVRSKGKTPSSRIRLPRPPFVAANALDRTAPSRVYRGLAQRKRHRPIKKLLKRLEQKSREEWTQVDADVHAELEAEREEEEEQERADIRAALAAFSISDSPPLLPNPHRVPYAPSRLDLSAEALIKQVNQLQRRAWKENRVKAHAHPRLLFGLREIAKKIDQSTACVVVATDCHEALSLGLPGLNQLELVNAACARYNVPFIKASTRSRLATAASRRPFISAAAVLDAQGRETFLQDFLQLWEENFPSDPVPTQARGINNSSPSSLPSCSAYP